MIFTRTHPKFERLRAFAAKELSAGEREKVAAHLVRCATCRREVSLVRTVVAAAAESFAPPVPAGALERVLSRRASGERVILPSGDDAETRSGIARRRVARRRGGLAVGLTMVVAGSAAAVTTLPVRKWITQLRRPDVEAPVSQKTATTVAAPAPEPKDPAPSVVGVALPVTSRELWVAIDRPDPGLRIRFRLTSGTAIEVRGIGGATDAVFRPRPNGIGVVNAGTGELQVDVPRSVQRFELRVDGAPYLAKTGSDLRVLATRVDTAGTDLILSPTRRPTPAAGSQRPKR